MKIHFNLFQKKIKMLLVVIIIFAIFGLISWHFFVERFSYLDVEIPASSNIKFNDKSPIPMTTNQVADEFENADGKTILLYIYTTWCNTCHRNFHIINEIAQEFQNTNLQIIALSIDKEASQEQLQSYLNSFGDVFFQPKFLSFKDGFIEFLRRKNIHYNNRIPFTVLISSNGKVITSFNGVKSKNLLRRKIIKDLYQI